jgi:dUTP pyrophosphatase
MKIRVKKLPHCVKLPEYKTAGAVGMDVYAADSVTIMPRGKEIVRTGFCIELPDGYGLHLISRSGLFSRDGIHVEGLIDPDYRGEVRVMMHNHSDFDFRLGSGYRIAQAYVVEMPRIQLIEADELSETARGENGLGHTGVE